VAYRLRRDESFVHGLRRLARKQLRSAAAELERSSPPSDEAIHEARKRVKKIRAIAELIHADDGRGLGSSRKRLRKVNRALSTLRDADAIMEILGKLKHQDPRMLSEHTFGRVRRWLASRKEALMQAAARDRAYEKAAQELRALGKMTKHWRPSHRRFRALAAGMRLTYRRGRKALARARDEQRAADFHEWRKQIKALWYQLRLVEACSADIRRDVRALHRAEAWLGDDHNVAVLCEQLFDGKSPCREVIELARLRYAATRYQRDLRRKAVSSLAPLYSIKSGEYVRHIKRAWTRWARRRTRRTAAAPAKPSPSLPKTGT